MNLRRVEAFCRVVELGSVVAAADAMFCVPSNISKMLKDLEALLSDALFVRDKGNLIITPFGRRYYDELHPILENARRVERAFRTSAQQHSLSIGAIDVVIDHHLPLFIPHYMQKQPYARLKVFRGHSRVLEEGLYNHEYDAIFSDGPVVTPELNSRLIFKERLVPMRNETSPTDGPVPVYSHGNSCLYRDFVDDWVRSQPIGAYGVVETESYALMAALVRNSGGVGFIPQTIASALGVDDFCSTEDNIPCDIYFVWRRSGLEAPVATMLDAVEAFSSSMGLL